MIVKSLKLENYRNYKELSIDLDERINILYGDNAQGKTNILESIYVSGTTKSHRSNKDRELIHFDQDEAHIRTEIEKNEIIYKIDMHLKKNKSKGIAINGIPIKRASDLFGIVNFIFFSPEDLNIIKDGPGERRRFIDLELCQLDKIYLNNLVNYNKTLQQRNHLLREISYKPELSETLSIWNQQLVKYGCEIIKTRRIFIEELNQIAQRVHSKLTGDKEILDIGYEENIKEEDFLNQLEKNLEKDLKQRNTSVGPHKDDISFQVKNIDIRKYGSQGQQRTVALSLKLSEIDLVKKKIKDQPVLLLDDVLSELDSHRQNFLLNSLKDTQTIITCTGLDEFVKNRFHIDRVFFVKEGKVYQEE